jgi:hypothetical protein
LNTIPKAKIPAQRVFQVELESLQDKIEHMCQLAAEMLGPDAEVTNGMHQVIDCLQLLEWPWLRSQKTQESRPMQGTESAARVAS